jgi:hypothetical protein
MRRRLNGVVVGRALLALACAAFSVLVAVQVFRTIDRHATLARKLQIARADVATLRAKRAQQLRELRRLSDPAGAIPEIHDRLQVRGAREDIIYLKRERAP